MQLQQPKHQRGSFPIGYTIILFVYLNLTKFFQSLKCTRCAIPFWDCSAAHQWWWHSQRPSLASDGSAMTHRWSWKKFPPSWELTWSGGEYLTQKQMWYKFAGNKKCGGRSWKIFALAVFLVPDVQSCFPWPYFSREVL